MLLDCGSVSDVDRLRDYLLEIGSDPGRIALAVVTHMHPDHAGGALSVRRRYGVPLVAHRDADKWYRGGTGFIQHCLDCYMAQLVAFASGRRIRRVGYRRTLHADYSVVDGEHLPVFPDWTVVHVPGHTTHDLALFNMTAGILYCSDCIIHVGGKLNLPIPVFFRQMMKSSLARLAALGAALVIPAHGDPITMADKPDTFDLMARIADEPDNRIRRRFHRISSFAPDVWHWRLRNALEKRFPRAVRHFDAK